jgi:hypothetical protein
MFGKLRQLEKHVDESRLEGNQIFEKSNHPTLLQFTEEESQSFEKTAETYTSAVKQNITVCMSNLKSEAE